VDSFDWQRLRQKECAAKHVWLFAIWPRTVVVLLSAQSSVLTLGETQVTIAALGGVRVFLPLIQNDQPELVAAAVAALRNISIHTENELLIVQAGYIPPLISLLTNARVHANVKGRNESIEIKTHAVGTLRNLSANDANKLAISSAKGVSAIIALVMSEDEDSVLQEATAALALLASHGES
jgi:vacuolar protein 8